MQKYQDHVTDQYGNAQRGASVLVKTSAGATATIYSDDGVTEKDNPITTGASGAFEFYAANGSYVLNIDGVDSTRFSLLDYTEADTATPTSSSTVVGETGGVVKRFTVSDLKPDISITDAPYSASTGGVTSCVAALKNALESGAKRIHVPKGTFALDSQMSATLPNDVLLYGPGKFLYTGAGMTDNLGLIQCAGYSMKIDGPTFDGANLAAGGFRIENQSAMSVDAMPSCVVQNCVIQNFRMNTASIWNDGMLIRGSFELVIVRNNNVRNITRAAGTGVSGTAGTSGITVSQYDATHYVLKCIHEGNTYANISGGDLVGAAANVDHDAFKFFTPDPSNFTNADAALYRYAPATLESHGNTYRNARGRALKVQGIPTIKNEKIIRDAGYTNYGGSDEINVQWGVGTVEDIEYFYNDYLVTATVTSPIQSNLSLVSAYQGSWYNENSGSLSVRGLKVYNGIKTGVGTNITRVLNVQGGATPETKTRPLIFLQDVSVNRGSVDWIVTTSFTATANVVLRMDSIVLDKLTYSAIGTGSANTLVEVIANGIVHLDGVTTPANARKFVSALSPAGNDQTWSGKLTGYGNRGFLHNFNVGADYNAAPMLNGAALADPAGGTGGSLSVQSCYLADDASYTFERRGFNGARFLFAISVSYDYTTQGLFACGSGDVLTLSAHASHLFEPSTTGANLDTDGKVNLWIDGTSLNVKNRLGGAYSITVWFLG